MIQLDGEKQKPVKEQEQQLTKQPVNMPAQIKEQPQGASPSANTPQKELTFMDMYNILNPRQKPKTEEELAIERKVDKRRRVVNAFADGMGALANLYFTSKGAPPMKGVGGMSEAYMKKYEDGMAKRRALNDKYKAGLWQAIEADINMRDRKEALKLAQDNWQRDFDNKIARDNADNEYRKNQLAFQEKKDEEDRKLREQQNREDNKIKQANLAIDKYYKERMLAISETRANNSGNKKGKEIIPIVTPKNKKFFISRDMWDANYPSVFQLVVNDLSANLKNYEKDRFIKDIKNIPNDRKKTFVIEHIDESPSAAAFLKGLSEKTYNTSGGDILRGDKIKPAYVPGNMYEYNGDDGFMSNEKTQSTTNGKKQSDNLFD